ncbi:MAG: DUF2087 domain-containing protein [Microbacteriaceae bacterium]|nr:DUF2087 domain-containing protein [Microbacteriaceae bacterium]
MDCQELQRHKSLTITSKAFTEVINPIDGPRGSSKQQGLWSTKSLDFDRQYIEPEVNDILCEYFEDHVFARRLLIEWGYLDRRQDGSSYWRLK